MGMLDQCLTPGMEDADATDIRAQSFGIGGKFQEGFFDRAEHAVIEMLFIAQGKLVELLWNGEHHMEISYGQHFLESIVHPLGAGAALASWAMAITA
jgi:hypothetical protein